MDLLIIYQRNVINIIILLIYIMTLLIVLLYESKLLQYLADIVKKFIFIQNLLINFWYETR